MSTLQNFKQMKNFGIVAIAAMLIFASCHQNPEFKKEEKTETKKEETKESPEAQVPNRQGILSQVINVSNIEFDEIKFEAWAKAEVTDNNQFQFWVRVDSVNSSKPLFFDNMYQRPIKENSWKQYTIQGKVGENAQQVVFGGMLFGIGKTWIDDVKIYVRKGDAEWTQLKVKNSSFEKVKSDNKAESWGAFGSYYTFTTDDSDAKDGKTSYLVVGEPKPKHVYNAVPLNERKEIRLPNPDTRGTMTVEKAMSTRRSVRSYADKAFTKKDVSQILWAAYGVSDSTKYKGYKLKTAPSAGALYPFEVYLVVNNVKGLETGVYRYKPANHSITMEIKGNISIDLTDAAWGQDMIEHAPINIVWTAIFERTTKKYGERGRERYVCMDLGHSGQNVYLQATALGMGTCAIGAFADDTVSEIMNIPVEEEILYIMPVGWLK